MPHVLALTRPPTVALPGGYREHGARVAAPLEEWLGPVAETLAMAPYDLRLRVAGPAPWVLARVATSAEAEALTLRLRELGCGAVSGDLADVVGAHPGGTARVFLREEGVGLEPERRTLAYERLALVVRATIEQELATETVRYTPNTFDGITRHSHERTRRHALYLFERDDLRGARLLEGTLGFPELAGTTARARLDAFVAELRARAPSALFHDRLVAEPRRRTTYRAILFDTGPRGAVQGNLEETDLAAWILALGLAQRQLE